LPNITMKKILFLLIFPVFLSLGTCTISDNKTKTIWWEINDSSYIQFYTNDPEHCGYSFVTWSESTNYPMNMVEVKVKKISGSPWGGFGIVFCLQDFDNFYLLGIDVKGNYTIYKRENSYWTQIQGWTYSNSLNKGFDAINKLTIEYDNLNARFSIYFNDTFIIAFFENSFPGGHFGFYVDVLPKDYEDFPNTPVDVQFKVESNITVNPVDGLETTESGGTDSFTVSLETQPTADVIISLSSSDTSEGVVSPTSLTFTPTNWSTPQQVIVSGVDDILFDGDQVYEIITAPAESTDLFYKGMEVDNVMVINIDNEVAPIPPSNLKVTATATDTLELSWIDNSTNEDGFKIERKEGSDGSYIQIDTVGADITAYNDTVFALTLDTLYSYRIRSYNSFGDSNYSNEASVTQKMLAFDAQAGDWFGISAAISGDYVIVGANGEDAGGSNAGAAYIFHRTGINSWDEGVKIVASDADDGDYFGVSVAISGDYAIVGAQNNGAAYIFHRTGTNSWDEGVKISASNAGSFGVSVAISGDYAIVGAHYANVDGTHSEETGAAFVFHRTGVNSWDGGVKIVAPDAQVDDCFGLSVAISGDYAVVGAPWEDAVGINAGAAYIFHRTGINSWDDGVKVVASDAQINDFFGTSVAISGDYAVIGADGEDAGGSNAGAAYIFRRTDTNSWDEGVKIVASDAQAMDLFGQSVAISGDYTVVGAYREGGDAGAVYVFQRTGTNSWDEGVKIRAFDAQAGDHFGVSAAIAGNYTVIGAYDEGTGGGDAGAAYIFYWE
jgi:hypothetical protein